MKSKFPILFMLCFSLHAFSATGTTNNGSVSDQFSIKDSCLVLEVQKRKRIYVFHSGMYASMKFENDSVYVIPRIGEISPDSIQLFKREFIDGEYTYVNCFTYHLRELKWINWDSLPQKKLRQKYHRFFVDKDCK